MPAGCPWWPAPPRHPPSATSWSRPASLGAAPGDLAGLRALLRATQPLQRYEPAPGTARAWAAAAARIAGLPRP